jgi:hypothetical protein
VSDGGGGWAIAGAPGAFVLLAELLALIATSLTGSEVPLEVGGTALVLGAIAGVLAPVAIVVTRRRDALLWAVVSVCATFLAVAAGALLLFGAAVSACGPNCLS